MSSLHMPQLKRVPLKYKTYTCKPELPYHIPPPSNLGNNILWHVQNSIKIPYHSPHINSYVEIHPLGYSFYSFWIFSVIFTAEAQ